MAPGLETLGRVKTHSPRLCFRIRSRVLVGTETESEHWESPWAVVGLARPHTGVLSAWGTGPWRVEEPGDPPAPTLWHDPPLQMGGVVTPA